MMLYTHIFRALRVSYSFRLRKEYLTLTSYNVKSKSEEIVAYIVNTWSVVIGGTCDARRNEIVLSLFYKNVLIIFQRTRTFMYVRAKAILESTFSSA